MRGVLGVPVGNFLGTPKYSSGSPTLWVSTTRVA